MHPGNCAKVMRAKIKRSLWPPWHHFYFVSEKEYTEKGRCFLKRIGTYQWATIDFGVQQGWSFFIPGMLRGGATPAKVDVIGSSLAWEKRHPSKIREVPDVTVRGHHQDVPTTYLLTSSL